MTDTTVAKPTILVVDDEAGPRDTLKVILRPFFNVEAADCAQRALQLLREHRVDLITLDQKLPDRQGLDLLQDIKHLYRDIEVIIITGYGSLKSAMDGIRHGAAGYLLKPFNVTELITLINQTLEKKKRLDYLRQILNDGHVLWNSEEQAAAAWMALRKQYSSLTNGKARGQQHVSDAAYTDVIPLLSNLLEAKDRNLLNHSSRVSFYATLLANRVSLSIPEQKSLAIGAFLHDLGMIGLDRGEIDARECGPLVSDDVKRHTELGAKMVLALGIPAEVGQIISYHHEHVDGLGYPHGLRGEGIPRLARIVGIAELFDHLTTTPDGLPSGSIDEALLELKSLAGTRLDPLLVDVFVQVVTECKSSLPSLAMSSSPLSSPDL